MQLPNHSEMENNLNIEASRMSLKVSATTFKLMFSSIYERKEEAVLRELAANALDAHVVAGIPQKPIEITLPTDLNPFLVIKDYGIGMSLDTVKKVYFTVCESTKTSNNDEIGGFGIGSKAPYAVSETYTVSTVNKGLRTDIIMTMDKGEPTPVIVGSEVSTDEPDGTTVTVPVDKPDQRAGLKNVVTYLFKYWDTPILVKNGTATKVSKSQYFDTNHYTEETTSYRWNHNTHLSVYFKNVLVGPFSYKIPSNMLNKLHDTIESSDKKTRESFSVFKKYIARTSEIVINTKIGALELAPSRERIEDTDANYETLKALILEIVETGTKEYKVRAKSSILYLDKAVPTNLDKYGLSNSTIKLLRDEVIKIIGSEDLVNTILSHNTISILDQSYIDMTSNILDRFKNVAYFSISEKEPLYKIIDIEQRQGYTSILRRFNTKRITVRNENYVRMPAYFSPDEYDDAEWYMLLDGENLTIKQKALINYNLKTNGSIKLNVKGTDIEIDTTNYFELCSDDDITEVKYIIDNYVGDKNTYYFTYSDIEPLLDPIPKRTVTSTSKTTKRTPINDTVVINRGVVYNSQDDTIANGTIYTITVDDLYKNGKFDKFDIIVTKNEANSYISTFTELEGIYDTFMLKQLLLIEIPTKEYNTKRLQAFLEKPNVTFIYSRRNNITYKDNGEEVSLEQISYLEKLLGQQDFNTLSRAIRFMYNNKHLNNCKNYLPKNYITVLDKYSIKNEDIDWSMFRKLKAIYFDSPENLYNNTSIDYYVLKALISGNEQAINLAVNTYKEAKIKKLINTYINSNKPST